jgi:hypothetical protein
MKKIIVIKFYLIIPFSIIFLNPFITSAQEDVDRNKAVENRVNFLSCHKNYIGMNQYFIDQYIWKYSPEFKISFPHKNIIIRSNKGFNYIYNDISTRTFRVFDSERRVQGDYFQSGLSYLNPY